VSGFGAPSSKLQSSKLKASPDNSKLKLQLEASEFKAHSFARQFKASEFKAQSFARQLQAQASAQSFRVRSSKLRPTIQSPSFELKASPDNSKLKLQLKASEFKAHSFARSSFKLTASPDNSRPTRAPTLALHVLTLEKVHLDIVQPVIDHNFHLCRTGQCMPPAH